MYELFYACKLPSLRDCCVTDRKRRGRRVRRAPSLCARGVLGQALSWSQREAQGLHCCRSQVWIEPRNLLQGPLAGGDADSDVWSARSTVQGCRWSEKGSGSEGGLPAQVPR